MTDETNGEAAEQPSPSSAHNGSQSSGQNGSSSIGDDFTTKAATVGVIFVGAALIEAGLIPGMLIGAAAVLAPKYAPQLGTALQPMFRSVVRNAYKFGRKAREAVAEAHEQVQDIVAEVHAEAAEAASAPEASGSDKA